VSVDVATKTRTSSSYITIGRHEFTGRQLKLLAKIGLTHEVERIEQVSDIPSIVKKAQEKGTPIIVQALPMHLLAQLVQIANRARIPVYSFEIQSIGIAKSREEAEELAKQHNADIILPDPKSGTYRVSKTVALQQVVSITVNTRRIATLD
jgi:hypothetical protein